jgi:hypothetical protein
MKRSTMIKKALNHDLNTVCVNEAQVERMLAVFEKLGMLPPEITEKSYKILSSGEMIYAVNEWEPEDEEK